METRYRIDGIRDLQRALRQVDQALPRQLRVIGNQAAGAVVRQANANASRLGRYDAQAAAAGLRARSEQRNVAVVLRATARVPWVLGSEFGADREARRSRVVAGHRHTYVGYRQFRPWGGNQWAGGAGRAGAPGYWFYPAVRSEGRKVVDAYIRGLNDLFDRHRL